MRRFTSPNGREWIADVFELPPQVRVRAGHQTLSVHAVLRFTSGDVTLDLARFPDDWMERSDDELVKLLRTALVPAFTISDVAGGGGTPSTP